MEPRSPALQADSLRAEPQGKRKNTGVGSLSLLQRIFPTQGSNLGLQHCRQILYELSHKGSPRILEWVAYPFSRGSSQPRDQTGVSCIAGQFFTNWAMREAQSSPESTDIWWISKICCPSKIKNHNLRPWWPSVEEFSSHCRRHSFGPWFGNIPHAAEQPSLFATTMEPVFSSPGSWNYWAQAPQLLKSAHPRAHVLQ